MDNSAAQNYPDFETDGGINTQDKVFLLSFVEANRYFDVDYWRSDELKGYPNDISRIEPTEYALACGAYTDRKLKTLSGSKAGDWWLRLPGMDQDCATIVSGDGSMSEYGVAGTSVCVRPAMWVDLDALP